MVYIELEEEEEYDAEVFWVRPIGEPFEVSDVRLRAPTLDPERVRSFMRDTGKLPALVADFGDDDRWYCPGVVPNGECSWFVVQIDTSLAERLAPAGV